MKNERSDITPALEVEDEFYERGCFFNGMRGEGNPACLASYMTCMDYAKLESSWAELKDTRPKSDWETALRHLEGTAYLSPSIAMFAAWLKRKVESIA